MKILMLYLGKRWGGCALYSYEIAKRLSRHCDLKIVLSEYHRNLPLWENSGISLIRLPTYMGAANFLSSLANVRKFCDLRNKVKEFSPDLIYYTMLHPYGPLLNLMFGNIPIVTTVHDPQLHLGERSPMAEILKRIFIRQSSAIVVLTRAHLEKLVGLGVPPKSIYVIPHGVFSFYCEDSNGAEVGSRRTERIILFFGRISRYKGIDVLLDAFQIIERRLHNAKLIIAGEGNLESYRAQLRRINRVEIINRWITDKEVGQLMRKADIVALPYRDASQSGVIAIAAAFGVPVVTTRTGGLSEQVKHGQTGILVPPNDHLKFAEACQSLLINSKFRQRLGNSARQYAKENWDWEEIVLKLRNMFAETLNHLRYRDTK